MSTHKHIDKICCVILALILVVTIVFANAGKLGIQAAKAIMGYEEKLFDTSSVHTIDITMDDWDSFIETCTDEEYTACTVIIDNEAYKNVAIRAKGNTSLSSVEAYGNDRYSFKIEFDHYDSTKNYYGLDKLCLNNIIQDNTYMKDYLCYQMMGYFGVDSPLCSYTYITVNGEDWGLYLAVEGIEESFLQRTYGSDYGELYKPDSTGMGGGRGNGGKLDMNNMEDFINQDNNSENSSETDSDSETSNNNTNENNMSPGERNNSNDRGNDKGGGMQSDDVSLIYTDDEYNSYSNIFDNAKTDISDSDKDRLISSLKQLNENKNIENIVNIEEVVRYFVVHNFVLNFDSYTGSMIHNYYLYEDNGQLSMIPWDYNLAFGGFKSASDATSLINYPIDSPVSGGTTDSRPMLAWIFNDEEYTGLYHEYFSEFISEYFDSGYFESMIDSVSEMISPYVEKDPTKFCTYEEFEEGISTLKEFCLLRAESINGQLNGTIASASDGQSQDSDSLIDGSDIVVSAMGSMGNTMGRNGSPGGSEKMQRKQSDASGNQENQIITQSNQENTTDSQDSNNQANAFSGEGTPPDGDAQGEPPDKPDGNFNANSSEEPPQMPDAETPQASSSESSNTTDTNSQTTTTTAENDTENNQSSENMQNSNGEPTEDVRSNGEAPDNNEPKDFNSQNAPTQNNSQTWILLGISAGVLIIGLLFALIFKRR